MAKRFGHGFVVAVLFTVSAFSFFTAFQYYKYWPRAGDNFYTNPFGLTVYSRSGSVEVNEWRNVLYTAAVSYYRLKQCAGPGGKSFDSLLADTNVVLLPEGGDILFERFAKGILGYKYVFMAKNRYNVESLTRGLLHVYLYADGRWLENIFNTSSLFKKCGPEQKQNGKTPFFNCFLFLS